ncbi:MAG: hypothetical protein ACYDCH_04500 [Gaiellaceae bacterium]
MAFFGTRAGKLFAAGTLVAAGVLRLLVQGGPLGFVLIAGGCAYGLRVELDRRRHGRKT